MRPITFTAAILSAGLLVMGSDFAVATTQQSSTANQGLRLVAYVAPTGNGDCSRAHACSLPRALGRTRDGGRVMMTRGRYGESVIRGRGRRSPVTIIASRGARVVRTLRVSAPDLRWRNLTVDRANVIVTGDRNVISGMHVRGGRGVGTVFVRGDNITIRDSVIEGGIAHDGVNIAATSGNYRTQLPSGCGVGRNPRCVTVNDRTMLDRVTVRNIGDVPGTANHSDCIQIYDTAHAAIRNSTIYNCDNGAIQTSPGQDHGIWGLTITGNFIARCATPSFVCRPGGAALDLRANASVLHHLTLDHNTVSNGSVRFPVGNPVRSARFNIVSSLSVARPCTTPLAYSLVASYPRGLDCRHVPGATSRSTNGNVHRPLPRFVDPARGNLRLLKPLRNVPRDRAGKLRDRDGRLIRDLGADGL